MTLARRFWRLPIVLAAAAGAVLSADRAGAATNDTLLHGAMAARRRGRRSARRQQRQRGADERARAEHVYELAPTERDSASGHAPTS